MGDVDAYLSQLPEEAQAAFAPIRAEIEHQIGADDLSQGTSYAVPAWLYRGMPLIGIHAGVKHLSLYPFSGAIVADVAPQLDGYPLSKGTIGFTSTQPLPPEVLSRVVALRRAAIDDKLA